MVKHPGKRNAGETLFDHNLKSGHHVHGKAIDISGNMKVLRKLAEDTKNPDGTRAILLQHILPTTIEYVDIVNSVYPVELVISIVYSNDQDTVLALREKGYNVIVPPTIEYMKEELWKDVAEAIDRSPKPIVLQEVGGYMSKWTKELSAHTNFKGIVEDTKNGLWRYQAQEELAVPILSMADTALKRVEDSLIGDACVYSLEKVMRTQLASILDGVRCGVVGWGNIGKSCATAFEGRNAVVSIYDINPVTNMLAFGRGFYPMPLKDLLQECDIVMGCSGRRSIRVADIHDIKDGAILCSASSKDIEIDLKGFAELCDIEDLTPDGEGLCPIEKYTVKETGCYFYVLKHGTPIDFLDMPLQGAILDCTFSELFVCMKEIAKGGYAPGVVELADELQIDVAQKWLPTYAETFAGIGAEKDKTFFFPESWHWQ